MACGVCNKNRKQYEVVDVNGKRIFGPTPFKTTADAMGAKHNATVREVQKAAI